MSKWSIIGLLCCAAGLVIVGFQMISHLMGQSGGYESLCLYDLATPEKLDWIDSLTWFGLDSAIDYIASAPLYIILLIVGGIFLVISGFVKN